jgi:hypothetical protein
VNIKAFPVSLEDRREVRTKRPLSALRNGRGGVLAEQFGSVTRRFPWSVIVIEALSPMVFIHTRRIIIVPSNQHLLGFLAPPFESHCRFGSHIYQLVSHGRKAVAGGASAFSQIEVATF